MASQTKQVVGEGGECVEVWGKKCWSDSAEIAGDQCTNVLPKIGAHQTGLWGFVWGQYLAGGGSNLVLVFNFREFT